MEEEWNDPVSSYNLTDNETNTSDNMKCWYVTDSINSGPLGEIYITYSKLHGYIATTVCLFGILSNSANIIVLTRKNMASSTNTLLLWLAVTDLLVVLDYLPFVVYFYIRKPNAMGDDYSTQDFSWICFFLFHSSFTIACHVIGVWLSIALAIFRFIYISKPTSVTYYCSQQRARIVIITIVILVVVLCIPNLALNTYGFYLGTPALNRTDSSNTSIVTNVISGEQSYYYPSVRSGSYFSVPVALINSWFQIILFKIVPCFLLVVLTILLLHTMRVSNRRRQMLKSHSSNGESNSNCEHNRTTRMLFLIVVLFMLTELPNAILTLIAIFMDCSGWLVYTYFGDLLDILALINNSINFILYCVMSKQFRTTFVSIFCP